MNETHELYKSGGSLVDKCTDEMEDDLSLMEKAEKIPIERETILMAKAAIELIELETSNYDETKAASMKFLGYMGKCEGHIDTSDVPLLLRIVEIREARVKQHKEMQEILLYFTKKLSRSNNK